MSDEMFAVPMRKTTAKPKRAWKRTPPPAHTPSTEEWVQIARRVLIEEGVVEVKIDRLAKIAGVTRGGFYWRFSGREELFDALLEDWQRSNTRPLIEVLEGVGTPRERLRAQADLYIHERGFSPAYDRAVRAWATLSPKVAQAVRTVDQRRIEALEQVFLETGRSSEEALVRARITYFHQVGYYAIGMEETREQRQVLLELYLQVLLD